MKCSPYPASAMMVRATMSMDSAGMTVSLSSPWGGGQLRTGLLGRRNLDGLLATAGALALVILKGGEAIGAGRLTFGVVYAFIRYVEMFFRPLSDLAEKYNILQNAMASAERIFLLMDTPTAAASQSEAVDLHGRVEEIRFDRVSLAYTAGEPVLRAIDLTLTAGQTVAIVESMKMQMDLKAPRAGIVETVYGVPGRTVARGEELVVLQMH